MNALGGAALIVGFLGVVADVPNLLVAGLILATVAVAHALETRLPR